MMDTIYFVYMMKANRLYGNPMKYPCCLPQPAQI